MSIKTMLNLVRAPPGSWVMLDENHHFVPLPREKILHTSPSRTSLSLRSPNGYPGQQPFNLESAGGVAFLTNQRIVYLPTNPSPRLQSFTAPILNLLDTRITAPFFGPNVWVGRLKPVSGGGIPAHHHFLDIKMTFRDGGAFDFHSRFEQVRDSLLHAMDTARESGTALNPDHVHLDQLPAYSADEHSANLQLNPSVASGATEPPARQSASPPQVEIDSSDALPSVSHSQVASVPDEAPPGYEEAQSTAPPRQHESEAT